MSLKKGIVFTYSGQIINILLGFINSVLIARIVGPANLGDYAIVLNFINLLVLILGFGIPTYLVYLTGSNKIKLNDLFNLVFSILIVGAIVLLILFSSLNKLDLTYLILPSRLLPNVYFYVYLTFLLQFFNSLLISFLNGKKRFTTVTFAAIILPGLTATFNLSYFFLKIQSKYDPIIVLLFFNLISLLFQFLLLIFSIRNEISKSEFELNKVYSIFKNLIGLSSVVYFTGVIQFLNYKLDLWVLSYNVSNKVEISSYFLATQISQLLWVLPSAIHTVLFSHISDDKLNDSPKIVSGTFTIVFIYAITASLVLYQITPIMVKYLYGGGYVNVENYVGILLLGIIPLSCSLILSSFFAGSNKFIINFKASAISFIMTLLFNFILIPKYGAYGAAYSSVISYLCATLFLYFRFIYTFNTLFSIKNVKYLLKEKSQKIEL